MRKLLFFVFLAGCGSSYPEIPCATGEAGSFIGTMHVVYDSCGDLLPDTDKPISIEVTEKSWVRECGNHWVNSETGWLWSDGVQCEELLDSFLRPTWEGYEGTILYELFCEDSEMSCRAKVRVDFVKEM